MQLLWTKLMSEILIMALRVGQKLQNCNYGIALQHYFSFSAYCLIWCTQRHIVNLVGHDLASSLEPLSLRRSVASLSLFYRYYNGRCPKGLSLVVSPNRNLWPHHTFLCSFTSSYCICPQSKYPVVLIQFLPTYCLTLEFTTCILLPWHL